MTQNAAVLAELKKGPLTPLVAWRKLGVGRLGARVWDLKQAGHPIRMRLVPVRTSRGNVAHVAEYSLAGRKGRAA